MIALLNKTALWLCYLAERTPELRARRPYRVAKWFAYEPWIEFGADLISLVAFGCATYRTFIILTNVNVTTSTGLALASLGFMSALHIDPAVATLVVGLAVAWIALQQWLVARHKLRLDLFEKRYKVYEASAQFLSVIVSRANFNDDDLWAFNIGTRDVVFLFPKRIKDYLHKIRCRALDMRLFQKQFTPLPVSEERTKLAQKHHDELVWLGDQLTKLPESFAPFLGFASAK
jgi:hypothetical protein